ncbi:hypothetical protein [Bacillus mycoides]|uniref:hypothetical protein n=1 Tax=Bacillus mycoides TaxID=1405 RepID=UPI003A80BADC
MITTEKIEGIKASEIISDIFKVKRIGDGVFTIIGFNYGEEEVRMPKGAASEVAEYINSYFGLRK